MANTGKRREKDRDTGEGRRALELVNVRRKEAGLPALVWSKELARCAAIRVEECTELFSHTRPDGRDWYTVDERIVYGENLGMAYSTPEGVVESWMGSPSHRDNLLDRDFTSCGIASYCAGGTTYWAQEFGY